MKDINEYAEKIARHYQDLSTRVERNKLFGVILNNTEIEEVLLAEHSEGLTITSKALDILYPRQIFKL